MYLLHSRSVVFEICLDYCSIIWERTELLTFKVFCERFILYAGSLDKCCRQFSVTYYDTDAGQQPPRTEVDHLLGHYQLAGTFNGVFRYVQTTVRHNVFEGGKNGTQHKFVPVLLNVYQVCGVYKVQAEGAMENVF